MSVSLYQPIVYGDTSGNLGGDALAADQVLSRAFTGAGGVDGTLVGDANHLTGHATGGNDTLNLTAFDGGTVIGDAIAMSGHAQGGDDNISILARGSATAVGDAVTLSGSAHGGNDTISVTASYGPAIAYGDAETMSDQARGGNDIITGSNLHGPVQLYGDAYTLSGSAVGGNDTLIAGPNPSNQTQMYGDAFELLGHAVGGNNTLISGPNDDLMWGAAAVVAPTATTGDNTFVFSPPNGHDTIEDFQIGKDHIELQGYGLTSFAAVANDITNTPSGSLLTFDPNDGILVLNDHNLTASDFLFV